MTRPEPYAEPGWITALDRWSGWLLLLLILLLPFELRATPPALTELQILFLVLMGVSAPLIVRERRLLLSNRIVVAALVFVAVQWVCALAASNFESNSVKAAIRYTAGAGLLCLVVRTRNRKPMLKVWSVAAIAAAIYGLVDYAGFGFPKLFRDVEFYFQEVRRLTGSFDYSNTAATYFALSLPIVWTSIGNRLQRIAWCSILWAALILTYSRGAILAVCVVVCLWSISRKTRQPLQLLVIGVVLYVGLAAARPLLVERVVRIEPRKPMNAQYDLKFNQMSDKPGIVGEMPIVLRNNGRDTWSSEGPNRVTLSFHWYDTINKKMVDAVPLSETPLPQDVASDQSVAVSARFQTPDVEGAYLLEWDLRYPQYNWFSTANGVKPAVVEADIHKDVQPSRGNGDVSRWYKREQDSGPTAMADVPRTQLWRAALLLARQHPLLGIGPDNFRLSYGKVLGYGRWDTNIHSNSLYLELLAGSGIAGLSAFLFLISRIRWRITPALLALGVGLVHGVVDFFLMTTPIYFGFWILMGCTEDEDRV